MSEVTHFFVDGKQFNAPLNLIENGQFTVRSIPRSYQVVWDQADNPFDKINQILTSGKNNILLIDEKILELYRQHLQFPKDRIFAAKATETFKTLEGFSSVIDFLYQHCLTKSDTLVVVGGGIIQDVGAFAAICYKRGIPWIHFPTTLLSMCDSCIGGKTGINYRDGKNQLALFSTPTQVIINPHFLKTLPQEAIQSGLGEILKLFITGGDVLLSIYQRIVQAGRVQDFADYKHLILGALSVKRSVVEEDEFELNYRKSMNYGHTLGHVIEVLSNFAIPHGLAVVIGMMLANELSQQNNLLSVNDAKKLNALCRDLLADHVLDHIRHIKTHSLLDVLQKDKKVIGKDVSFVMLKNAGDMRFVKLALDNVLAATITSAMDKIFKQ